MDDNRQAQNMYTKKMVGDEGGRDSVGKDLKG
jgi:hypothetical protein